MSCDIHVHVEIKVNGTWHHYNHPRVEQSYSLFSKMAGVRGKLEPIAPPRGLPADLSFTTKFDADLKAIDYHDHSWLSSKEAGEIEDWYENFKEYRNYPPLFGYLFGNRIDYYPQYPDDAEDLAEMGYEDSRIVFWFDN
jgi:hypothetical protein